MKTQTVRSGKKVLAHEFAEPLGGAMAANIEINAGSGNLTIDTLTTDEAEVAGWDGVYVGDAIWCGDPLIGLAAAATNTSHIRLGTMVIPIPLRRPWKVASEAVALDHLSDGRLTLGLGAGAVWMGWQGFPGEVTDTRTRAEMLGESIEILDLLFQRNPFDYVR